MSEEHWPALRKAIKETKDLKRIPKVPTLRFVKHSLVDHLVSVRDSSEHGLKGRTIGLVGHTSGSGEIQRFRLAVDWKIAKANLEARGYSLRDKPLKPQEGISKEVYVGATKVGNLHVTKNKDGLFLLLAKKHATAVANALLGKKPAITRDKEAEKIRSAVEDSWKRVA